MFISFLWGVFGKGGFCPGGLCPGVYVRGVFVWGVFVLIPLFTISNSWPIAFGKGSYWSLINVLFISVNEVFAKCSGN